MTDKHCSEIVVDGDQLEIEIGWRDGPIRRLVGRGANGIGDSVSGRKGRGRPRKTNAP